MYKLIYFIICVILCGCAKNLPSVQNPVNSNTSFLTGYQLANYDQVSASSFFLAYGDATSSDATPLAIFRKTAASILTQQLPVLVSQNLTYSAGVLSNIESSNLQKQRFTFDGSVSSRLLQIDFTTPTDTGFRSYQYNSDGRVVSWNETVKRPLRTQYFAYSFEYNAAGDVVTVVRNEVGKRGDTIGTSIDRYQNYDQRINPFRSFPLNRDADYLPAGEATIYSNHNFLSCERDSLLFKVVDNIRSARPDTILKYRSTRSYEYDARGRPVNSREDFYDALQNQQGFRKFNYTYGKP